MPQPLRATKVRSHRGVSQRRSESNTKSSENASAAPAPPHTRRISVRHIFSSRARNLAISASGNGCSCADVAAGSAEEADGCEDIVAISLMEVYASNYSVFLVSWHVQTFGNLIPRCNSTSHMTYALD